MWNVWKFLIRFMVGSVEWRNVDCITSVYDKKFIAVVHIKLHGRSTQKVKIYFTRHFIDCTRYTTNLSEPISAATLGIGYQKKSRPFTDKYKYAWPHGRRPRRFEYFASEWNAVMLWSSKRIERVPIYFWTFIWETESPMFESARIMSTDFQCFVCLEQRVRTPLWIEEVENVGDHAAPGVSHEEKSLTFVTCNYSCKCSEATGTVWSSHASNMLWRLLRCIGPTFKYKYPTLT